MPPVPQSQACLTLNTYACVNTIIDCTPAVVVQCIVVSLCVMQVYECVCVGANSGISCKWSYTKGAHVAR